MVTATLTPPKAVNPLRPMRFTVKQYFRMWRSGAFGDRRVELLNGRVYEMAAQKNDHVYHVSLGNVALLRHFGDVTRYWVACQGTVVLGRFGAPDPDFSLFDVPAGTPRHLLPLPFLVIEVSDTTYAKDSGIKLRSYAEAGIEDYWIENIQARRLEVYRKPVNPTGRPDGWRYDDVVHLTAGQSVAPLRFPNAVMAVGDLAP